MTSVSLDRIAQAFGMASQNSSDSHQYATVSSVNQDGSFQVQMNGAQSMTRAACLCNAQAGDRVLCVIHGGQVAAIARVGGVKLPEQPVVRTGKITKTYASNGFTLENDKLAEYGGIVVMPIRFSATTACEPGLCATIPAEYAPASAVRAVVFETSDWSTTWPGWCNVNEDGTVGVYGGSSIVWFGEAVWIKGA